MAVGQLRLVSGGARQPHVVGGRAAWCDAGRDLETFARSWWGDAGAEWVRFLWAELAERLPQSVWRRQQRGWVAAILVAAAIAHGSHRRPASWAEVLVGIERCTGVPRRAAFARWRDLARLGLTQPSRPPPWTAAKASDGRR